MHRGAVPLKVTNFHIYANDAVCVKMYDSGAELELSSTYPIIIANDLNGIQVLICAKGETYIDRTRFSLFVVDRM